MRLRDNYIRINFLKKNDGIKLTGNKGGGGTGGGSILFFLFFEWEYLFFFNKLVPGGMTGTL